MIFAAAASAVVLARQEPVKFRAGESRVRVLPGRKPRRAWKKRGRKLRGEQR